MVSKSTILGKSSIIFVTVGTTQFTFDRLLACIDCVLIELDIKSQIIVQTGLTSYKWQYIYREFYQELSPQEMISYIKKADRIITHGGFGTMHAIMQHTDIMPLIVARRSEYKEHVDNHQLEFLKFCQKQVPQSYSKYFVTARDLKHAIADYLQQKPQKNILEDTIFNSSRKKQLENKLKNYLG